MERVVSLTLLALALTPLHADPQHPKATPKKTSAASPARKSVAAPRSASVQLRPAANTHATHAAPLHGSSAAAMRNRSGKKTRTAHAAPAPSYQLHPDPERYQTIQKALADRGYFKGDPNGTWGDDSVDALRRFQADQKIDNDGKIDALSLIALGLGPKHDGSTAAEAHVTAASDDLSPGLLQPSTPDTAPAQPQ